MAAILRELTLRWSKNDSLRLVGAITDFCRQSDEYEYLRDESIEYQRHINTDACIILAKYAEPLPILSFATADGDTLRLTNIVPGIVSEIGIGTYNRFISHFAKRFRSFGKGLSPPIRVDCTNAELTLEAVIPGKQTRKVFQRYLDMYPTSYHPFDVERLDAFICIASVRCRHRINTHRLYRYLTEVLEWTDEKASWCTKRIETGLDVLEMKRKERF